MADIDLNSLKPNSHKYKAEESNKEEKSGEKLKPVVSKDAVVSTKKPFGKKIAEAFLPEDVKNVKKWLFNDVIIPGIQNAILDGLQMMFFGRVEPRKNRSRRTSDDYTDYRSSYRGNSYDRRRKDDYYGGDDRVDFRNIILRNREDAERVVEELRVRIRQLGSASIADLFDLVEIPGKYTDNNYGWTDDRDIGIRRVSSGYLIDVADPRYLD